MITWYQNMFESAKVVVGMVTIGIIGFVIDRLLRSLEYRLASWCVDLTRERTDSY